MNRANEDPERTPTSADDESDDPRRDRVGGSGVWPASAENIPDDAEIRFPGQWADYNESGTSEIIPDAALRSDTGAETSSASEEQASNEAAEAEEDVGQYPRTEPDRSDSESGAFGE